MKRHGFENEYHARYRMDNSECDVCIDNFYEMLVATLEKKGPLFNHEVPNSD